MVTSTGYRKWSSKEEILSIIPWTPLTIGLIDMGFLCGLVKKYNLGSSLCLKYVKVISSMYPLSLKVLKKACIS